MEKISEENNNKNEKKINKNTHTPPLPLHPQKEVSYNTRDNELKHINFEEIAI